VRKRPATPKYQKVLDQLESEILGGKYPPGAKLPSEAGLSKRFNTSRITVGRAVSELRRRGLIDRRAGSGTYVRTPVVDDRLLFGLLIPNLGHTEIFEPICQGMAEARRDGGHALLWGHAASAAASKETQASLLCEQFIERNVSGVFFAPLEFSRTKDVVNRRIAESLDGAGIPVVLLDRCFLAYPHRSKFDLVGIDNRRAGYMITEHLLNLGARRVAFVYHPDSAWTVDARIAGYREAMFASGAPLHRALVNRLDAQSEDETRRMMADVAPEAIVCANDRTAGHLMQTLLKLGVRIPEDVRIAGFDDVDYASMLPVPLTTIRQPCREIGEAALTTMLERIRQPELPARDILLACELVVRRSCGSLR
jgi:DNA-binding LacI/PurR family transcriptional regulator